MQCTRNGGGFDWRIEVEQCDSSAIVFEEEITREMGGGGLDRVSRAGRANSSAEREREWSLLQTSGRRDDGEGRDDLVFLEEGNDTRTVVVEEV